MNKAIKLLVVILCLVLFVGAFNVFASTQDVIMGDANDDATINNKDAVLLLRNANGWNVTINLVAADVNGDGNVNNKDFALIVRYINGWNVEFSAPRYDDIGIELPMDKW